MENKTKTNEIIDAAVERLFTGAIRICWDTAGAGNSVTIYHGYAPDAINRKTPVAVSDHGSIDIHGLDPGMRHCFEIVSGDNRMVVSERHLKLDGPVNFRDIGGYVTHDGRRVKWGRLFRADGLARLSDRDLALFRQIGIRRIIDFRTESEAANAPDRIPEGGDTSYIHLPVTHGKYDFAEAVKRFKKGDTDWLTADFMVEGYINNLESFARVWEAVVFHVIDEKKGPLVFHCTGGKDRTGTCAALLLLTAGIPEDVVIDDHQLSNIYIARLLPDLYRLMSDNGIDPDRVFPYLTAPRDCIEAVISHISYKYGSAWEYFLSKTSLTETHLAQLKNVMLE